MQKSATTKKAVKLYTFYRIGLWASLSLSMQTLWYCALPSHLLTVIGSVSMFIIMFWFSQYLVQSFVIHNTFITAEYLNHQQQKFRIQRVCRSPWIIIFDTEDLANNKPHCFVFFKFEMLPFDFAFLNRFFWV